FGIERVLRKIRDEQCAYAVDEIGKIRRQIEPRFEYRVERGIRPTAVRPSFFGHSPSPNGIRVIVYGVTGVFTTVAYAINVGPVKLQARADGRIRMAMKFGYFTLSDNHYVNNARSSNQYTADITNEAIYADEIGMHSAWIGEHHFG